MSINKPTTDAFLGTIKKSGLIEPDRLQKAVAEFETSASDQDDSIALAEFLVERNVLTKWQAEKLLQGKHKGYFLGKYRLLSLLGKGGMSSVFLAEHILMRRRCAIKVLPTKRVADSSYLARFHREAQAVAALDHPNIVRAYDVDHQVDRDAEIHFLVMEYVEGSSLQELVASTGPTEFYDAADYIRQAALGLESAHRAGMVHRDIKPGNLLVDPNGVVKLLDLGLARYFSSEEEGTALTIAHDEKVLGTADYLAPEQALDSHTVDHRADIYSLGCTLYFLLTGHPPFTEGTLAQRLMAHQTKEPPLVEKDRPDTPPSLGVILRKMMAKKSDDRYGSAAEVADVFLHWLSDHADAAWKQSHAQLFGGMRGSDTKLGSETVAAVPSPSVQQLMMTMAVDTQDADTEIVSRKSWPTGDLSTTADNESEPELSAFFSQMQTEAPIAEEVKKTAPARTSPAPPKSALQNSSPKPLPAPPPAGPTPSFDFLNPAQTVTTANKPAAPAAPAKPVAAKPTPAKAAAPGPPKSSPAKTAPQAPAPAVPHVETSFPNFDFVDRAPASPPVTPQKSILPPPAPVVPAANPPPVSITKSSLPPMKVTVAVVVGAALVGAMLFYFLRSPGSPTPVAGPKKRSAAEAIKSRLCHVYGDNADFSSVQESLTATQKYFQPNTMGPDGKPDVLTISIAAGTHSEQINFDGSKSDNTWPDGVIVRGAGEVIFTSDQDGPVVSLSEVPGLTIENITIDAGKKPVGMLVSGFMTKCLLKQLHIRNFSDAGLVCRGSQAFVNPMAIDQLRCDAAVTDSAVGVRIEPHVRDGKSDDANNIAITQGRFFGPLAAGISIDGSFPYQVSIRESIFAKSKLGIRFNGAGRWRDFIIANNSFFQCPVGISFTAMPDPITSGFSIRRNLFAGAMNGEAVVQAGYAEPAFLAMLPDPAGLEWNWSDRAAPATPLPEEVNLFGVNGKRGEAGFAFDTIDIKSPKFLAPSANSPQKSAPSPRPEDKPWVGAVGP